MALAAANRFNLVIAGDGYTEAEQSEFRQQVNRHLNVLAEALSARVDLVDGSTPEGEGR